MLFAIVSHCSGMHSDIQKFLEVSLGFFSAQTFFLKPVLLWGFLFGLWKTSVTITDKKHNNSFPRLFVRYDHKALSLKHLLTLLSLIRFPHGLYTHTEMSQPNKSRFHKIRLHNLISLCIRDIRQKKRGFLFD